MNGSKSKDGAFNLFTHQEKRELEGTSALVYDYKSLREAVLELYLSVKIRSDEEIDDYNKELFEKEKKELIDCDGYKLVDQIKSSIEMLMNMKMDDDYSVDDDIDNRKNYRDIGDSTNLDNLEVDLPEGAKKGLKDATINDHRLSTGMMEDKLQQSLPRDGQNKKD